jgi:glycine C-acetyltransferase
MDKLEFIRTELAALRASGLYGTMRTVESPQGAWIIIDGHRLLNLCSNGYLGLSNSPRLKRAVRRNMEQYGIGAAAARLISGTHLLHVQFEQALARFKRTDDALFFASGWCANIGIIQAVTGKGDIIFSDALNHGSLIDACRLSRAKTIVYEHLDVGKLEQALDNAGPAGRKLIVTDGVFSMDGDLAPLPEIVRLAEKHQALVMVDDAHGEGVLGDHGRGIVNHFGLHGKVDIEMGTMSKAFGVIGGYIAGSRELIEFLKQRARTSLLATAPSLVDVAACIAAIEIVEESDQLVKKLWRNTHFFKKRMQSLGFDIGHSETPIVPVMVRDERLTQTFEEELFKQGVFAHAIVYPTVPKGEARLRIQISASHKRNELNFALDNLEKIGHQLRVLG